MGKIFQVEKVAEGLGDSRNCEAMITRFASTDKHSLIGTLLTMHYAKWLRHVTRKFGWTGAAEEIMQEASLRAYVSAPHFHFPNEADANRIGKQFSLWFQTIVHRAAIDMLRLDASRLKVIMPDNDVCLDIEDEMATPDRVIQALDLLHWIVSWSGRHCSLNERVMLLGILTERDTAQVVLETGIPKGTADSGMHHVRRKLRAAM